MLFLKILWNTTKVYYETVYTYIIKSQTKWSNSLNMLAFRFMKIYYDWQKKRDNAKVKMDQMTKNIKESQKQISAENLLGCGD